MTEKQKPDLIYRFRPAKTVYFWRELEEAVFHNRIFLSPATDLNDPFDFRPRFVPETFKAVKEALDGYDHPFSSRERYEDVTGESLTRPEWQAKKKLLKDPVTAARFLRKINQVSFEKFPKKTRLACFTTNPQCVPMWAHYASDHSGVCIEYEVILNGPPLTRGDLVPIDVSYEKKRPQVYESDFIRFSKSPGASPLPGAMDVFDALCYTKADDWAYEKEQRVCVYENKAPRYHDASRLKVNRVFFGIKADEKDVAEAIERFGSRIAVSKVSQAREDFGFEDFIN